MNNEKNFISITNDYTSNISTSNTPLVTIGITNYNGNNYLDQCITSILSQSYKSIEIIIVDDDSMDGSIKNINNLEAKYKNITAIYHIENSGSPDLGREEILKAARGMYIVFVDSDDYLADEMAIEKLLQEFDKSPDLDYVYCNMLMVDKESNNIGLWNYKQYSDEELIHDTFQRGGSGVIPMKGMFKRNFFIRNNLSWHNNETAGDTLSALIYTKHGWKYKHLNLNLFCYRQYDESFSFNLEKRIKAILRILDYIIDNFSEEIYFSRIPWKEFDPLTKCNFKNYLLGQFYFELLKIYYSQWSSWSKNKGDYKPYLIESLTPLRNKVLFYLEKWDASNYPFDSKVENILKEVESIFQM